VDPCSATLPSSGAVGVDVNGLTIDIANPGVELLITYALAADDTRLSNALLIIKSTRDRTGITAFDDLYQSYITVNH
jgi:hypothetical protein